MSLSTISYSFRKIWNSRCLVPVSKLHQFQSAVVKPNTLDWNRAVSEAENVVGYPTSFLNLRWLLNDEAANIASHLKRLIGTDHPLLRTARGILLNQMPAWGLMVLLTSKAAGIKKEVTSTEYDLSSGILNSQRVLAEVTEMIRMSNIIHKALFNLQKDESGHSVEDDLNFGNKIALLSGDYLLSKSYHELACIRNQDLNEIMSSALRDLVECEFLGVRDTQNCGIPSKPKLIQTNVAIPISLNTDPFNVDLSELMGNMESEWTFRNLLGGGSLLAKSCQGALNLAGHSMLMQEYAHEFGRHVALAWHASFDLNEFKQSSSSKFNLLGAPVMCHLAVHPDAYEKFIEPHIKDVTLIDYKSLWLAIQNGGALNMCTSLISDHANSSIELLHHFENDDAKTALRNIVDKM